MHEDNRTNKLLTTVIVLLVLVLIGLFLLIGTIVLADYIDPERDRIPQTSQSEQVDLPEKQPEEPVEEPEEPSSSDKEIVPPAQPSKPQTSGGSSSASSKTESSASATYQTKTYKQSTSDDRTKTYGAVSVQAGDIYLANKTVKGDMTISKDAEGGVELDHCIIEGTLYIKGGESVILTNTRVGKIVVRDGYGRDTVLIADGLTRTGMITAYTDVVLDESGLDPKRPGFSELKIAEGKPVVVASLISTELNKAILKEETELYLDDYSLIKELRVDESSVIDGTGSVGRIIVAANDIVSYIVPDEEKKVNSRYDDVTYLNHNIPLAPPKDLAVTYDAAAGVYRFGWTAGDAVATGYAVEISAEETLVAKTVTELSVVVDDAFMNRDTTFRVRAITNLTGFDPSEWVILTTAPAQVGEINNFMVNTVGQDGLVLGWDAAANVDSYTLTWQQVGEETATTVNDITGTSYTVAGLDLSAGKEYRFALQVVGAAQARPAFNGKAETSFAVKKLASPVVSAAYTDGLLTFSWTKIEGASNFSVSGSAAEYAATETGYASSVAVTTVGNYSLNVKAEGGFNQTEGILYLDSDETARNITASHLEMTPESLKVSALTTHYISAVWNAVPQAAGYNVVLTQNGVEIHRVVAVVPSYTYAAPYVDNMLSSGRDYTITVSVKAPKLEAFSDQLYLDGSAVVASASVREEHGLIAEGEGKTHMIQPAAKDTVLAVNNLVMSDKYNYSLKLMVGETEHRTMPYTLDENGIPQLTFAQLMLDDMADMPTAYSIVLSAEDKNTADTAFYLGKTLTILNVSAE